MVKRIYIRKPLAYIYFVLLITAFLASCSVPSSYFQKEPVTGVYHLVKKGETFANIARAYNVKLQDLAEVNNITTPGLLEEGSAIFIPEAKQVIDNVAASVKAMDTESKRATTAPSAAKNEPPVTSNGENSGRGAAEVSKKSDKKTLPPAVKPERTKQARLTPHEDTTSAELPPAGKTAGEKLERKHQAKVATEEKEEIQFDKRRFIWPVQGTVKTHFGIQPNKTDFHNWIKIVSPAGTQVKAATSGMVIYSAQLKTFGETIIIRHEDSFATVYTHLKKRYVKIDQNVKKGEVIALIGVTDEASDAYMNFEVRLRGKARNPLFFLP